LWAFDCNIKTTKKKEGILMKELKHIWRRCIVVQVSPRKSIVAEPALQDGHYKACTKPIDHTITWKLCNELNDVAIENWSDLLKEHYIDE